jgi:hypothetical protein
VTKKEDVPVAAGGLCPHGRAKAEARRRPIDDGAGNAAPLEMVAQDMARPVDPLEIERPRIDVHELCQQLDHRLVLTVEPVEQLHLARSDRRHPPGLQLGSGNGAT